MKPLLLSILAAILLPSCAGTSTQGLSFAYETATFGLPAAVSYADGKAVVSVQAPWRKVKPEATK
jgi:hypothetical protein